MGEYVPISVVTATPTCGGLLEETAAPAVVNLGGVTFTGAPEAAGPTADVAALVADAVP